MTVREKTLELLQKEQGNYLSGAEIAEILGVTRTAVWKAVKSLQNNHYAIDAVTNRGYRLAADCDVLTEAGLRRCLLPDALATRVEVYRSVDSTNTVLRGLAAEGAPEGTAVLSGAQTAGRGRFGRSFFSPSDSGVYLSLLLRPDLAADRSVLITTAAAVSVCEAVSAVAGLEPAIKWVNDILVDGKKVCGILTEASFGMETGRLDYAIVGIGINVYAPDGGFPPELREIAGSLFPQRRAELRNQLAAEVLNRFSHHYKTLEQPDFIEEYRRRSAVIGRRVTVLSGGKSEPAAAIGIDDECRLLVRYDDGRQQALSSGEISIRL